MQFLITSFNKKDGIKTNKMFYLTRPLLLGDFRKSSPVHFFTLKEGAPPLSHKSPLATPKSFTLGNDQMNLSLLSLNQDFPFSEGEDLKPGRPGLYEQTSSRPKGLLVIIYATELRVFMRRGRPSG